MVALCHTPPTAQARSPSPSARWTAWRPWWSGSPRDSRRSQGEWPSDTSIGLPWLDWIEAGRVPPAEAEALVRGQVEDDPAVVSVDAVSVTTTGEAVAITVRATIATEGATAPVVLTVGSDPYATRAAPPWYLSSGALRYTRGALWGA